MPMTVQLNPNKVSQDIIVRSKMNAEILMAIFGKLNQLTLNVKTYVGKSFL
jgi:hypothetical protein